MIGGPQTARAREAAEALALGALAFVAADEDRLTRLLASSGLDPADLAARAGDPEFLGFVLDAVLSDEETAATFAAVQQLSPEDLHRARAALPGAAPEW